MGGIDKSKNLEKGFLNKLIDLIFFEWIRNANLTETGLEIKTASLTA